MGADCPHSIFYYYERRSLIMAVTDFVRRSMQIATGGILQSTTDYFDNAMTFVNDVKEVMDMGKQIGNDSVKKFNELRHSGILKKTRDWFYNEGGMFGDFDFDDDEFDAGFEIESADSERQEKKESSVISTDSMTDIAKKQTGAMYKAFGRQADLHIANTAEIVSTINSRSAELTASVNNMNNTLIQIGKRLDLIVEYTSSRVKKEQEAEANKTSIIDYGGGISLSGVFNKLKENAQDSSMASVLSTGKMILGSGMMTPENILSMILSQTILDKQFKGLGGKSINEIGEFVNDTIGEAIQNGLSKALNSKNGILATLFEDLKYQGGNKNYQNAVINQYNEKPAIFDGMTRKSIITIIPGYLNEILKAVSKDDTGMEISNKGTLTKKKTNAFVESISSNYFRSGMMEYDQRKEAHNKLQGFGLSSKDIQDAVRTLSACWLWEMYSDGGRVLLEQNEVKDITYPSTRRVIEQASELMASQTKYSVSQWKMYYQTIIGEIEEFKFRQELQYAAQRADKEFENFAKTNVNAHQAGRITKSVLTEAFRHNYKTFNNGILPSDSSNTSANGQIGNNVKSTKILEIDYLAGMFDRLNRGINVYVTGQSNNRSRKYPKINMIPGYAARNMGINSNTDSDESNIKPVTETISNILTGKPSENKLRQEAPPDIQELYTAKDAGEKLSKSDEKRLKEYEDSKKTSIKSWFKNKVDDFAHESRKTGIVANPADLDFMDSMFNKTKSFFSSLIPENRKKVINDLKETEAFQKVADSKAVNKAKEIGHNAGNKVGDILLGKQSVDEDGENIRTGGLLHKGAKGIQSTTNKAGDIFSGMMGRVSSTKTLKNRTMDLMNEYGPEKQFEQDDTDSLTMQTISNMVNVAMSNGGVDTLDEQTIMPLIDSLKDVSLKRKLKQSLIPLMKRNSSNSAVATGAEAASSGGLSTIGKLKTMIFGAAKMFINPVVTYVKLVIGSVFAVVKNGMGMILNLVKKGVKSGLTDLKAGAKAFGSGIKDVAKGLLIPATKMVNLAFKAITTANKFFMWAGKGLYKHVVKPIIPYVVKGFKVVGNVLVGIVKGIGTLIGKIGTGIAKLGKKIANTKVGQGVIKGAKWVGNKLFGGDQMGFVGGVLEANKIRKEEKQKAADKAAAKPIKDGVDDSELSKNITEVIDSSDGKKGFFKNLLDTVKGIFNKMPDNGTSTENQNNQTTSETETPELTNVDTSSSNSGDNGGGKGKRGFKSLVTGGIGKILGGISIGVMGLVKMIGSIITGLEGFKALTNMIQKILTESLQPLNEAFQAITKTLKPFFKEIGSIVKMVAKQVVEIVKVALDIVKPILEDVIQPILKSVSPLLETILGVLTPLLKVVGVILKAYMVPLMATMKFVVVPIMKVLADYVQIIAGVIQVGLGGIMGLLGGLIAGVGGIISTIGKLPGLGAAKSLGKNIADSGVDMAKQGGAFIKEGGKLIIQGTTNLASDIGSMIGSIVTGNADEEEEPKKKEIKKIEPTDEDVVKRTYANGDITNIYNNGSSDIYNTYGGEYQRGMGGYLNMDQRGCGPIALADMFNRSGGGISARSLAGSMYGSGAYDPRRGTSVGGYINTARSLGMNLVPGRVTQQSLKSATPNHPITVVGSGSDYGTRNGNNHFMNVIGTDRHGGAYVSNPLTGHVDRRPASTIAGSAVVGLYGSGDEPDGGYTFPDAIREAFSKLKAQANKILGLFSMEKSDEEEIDEMMTAEQNKAATEQAKRTLGEEEYLKIEKAARENARQKFMQLYPMKDGETKEEYGKRFQEYWEKNSAKYLAEAKLYDKASENNKNAWQTLANTSNDLVNAYAGDNNMFDKLGTAYEDLDNQLSTMGDSNGSSGGSGYFTSNEGVPLWTPYSDNIEITSTDITKNNYNSPLFEFFAKTMGLKLGDIVGSSWFKQRNNPNKEGVGSAGGSHSGIDFTGGSILGKPLYATTGGEVIVNWSPEQSGGGGNTVIWKDSAGKLHWYMHMSERSKLKVGDTIEGGDLIGYAGSTGHSTGPHLHYTINDTISGSGSGNVFNPLTYFGNYNPSGGSGLVGDTDQEKIYAYLISHGFLPHAAAGAMGCFQVESSNNPDTLEGYYAFDASTVKNALKNYDTLDDYTVNKLFPMYDRSGLSINKAGYKGSDGHYYPGLGLAQWTGGRTRALADYTINKGKTWNDLQGQLDYLNNEVTSVSRYNSALTKMNNSNNVNEATSIWLSEFEGVPGNKLAERQAYANDFYTRYKNFTPTSKTYSPTGSGSVSTGFGLVNSPSDGRRVDNYNQIKSATGKNTGHVMTDSGDLNMRAQPNINSSILIGIPKGTQLNLEASGDPAWFKTTYAGKTGYVSSQYIALDNDDANGFDYSPAETKTYNFTSKDIAHENFDDMTANLRRVFQGGNKPATKSITPAAPSWYDFGSWFTLNDNATERNQKRGYYKDAANYHLKAQQGIGKNGKKATGSEKKIIDNYIDTYGANVVTRGNSTWFGDEWEYYADGWQNIYDSTKNKSNVNYSTYPISKQLQALGKIYASGDMSDLGFWNTYMDWNNNFANSNVFTPIDNYSPYTYSADTNDGTGTAVITNNYNISRAEDTETEKRLRAILANTYNVRSESMEAILLAILDELRKRKDPNGGTPSNGSVKLFDERIPAQVTSLSIG